MHGIGGSTLRGGQTVFHGIRMWGQLFQAALLFAAFMTVAVPAWNLWRSTAGAEWYAAGMVTLAESKLALGYDRDSGQEIRFEDGTRRVLRIRDIAVSVPALPARERLLDALPASAWLDDPAQQEWVEARVTPHPLRCLTDTLRLTGAWETVGRKMHVLATANDPSPFHAIHAGVASGPGWQRRRIDGPHDLMISHPEETAALLLEAAG